MGCAASIPVNGLRYSLIAEVRHLGLKTSDILQLLKYYNGQKHAQICVLFKLLSINHEFKYMAKIFSAFRENQMSDVFEDFRDYILSLYHFCTLSEKQTIKFGLELYGVYQSGRVDAYCLIMLIKDIFGYEYTINEFANGLIEKLEKVRDKQLEPKVINAMIPSMKEVFAPILKIQSNARKKTLTKERWRELFQIRESLDTTVVSAYFQKVNPNFCRPVQRTEPNEDSSNCLAISGNSRIRRLGSTRANMVTKVQAFQISHANAKQRVLELQRQRQLPPANASRSNPVTPRLPTTQPGLQRGSSSKRLMMSFRTHIMRRLEEDLIEKGFADVSGHIFDHQSGVSPVSKTKTNFNPDTMQSEVDRIINPHPQQRSIMPGKRSPVNGTIATINHLSASIKFKAKLEEEVEDC